MFSFVCYSVWFGLFNFFQVFDLYFQAYLEFFTSQANAEVLWNLLPSYSRLNCHIVNHDVSFTFLQLMSGRKTDASESLNFCRQQLIGQILKQPCQLLLLGAYFQVQKLHSQRWLIRFHFVFGRMRHLALG